MKILYVSHYFPPEIGAPAGRVAGLARQWVREGHEVEVLTGFPHHPTGIIPSSYRAQFRKGYALESYHGVRVHRTWIFPAANRGKFLRSLNYLSFMVSAAFTGSLRIERPDIVIATSPQLLCAGAGWLLARRFGVPLVMEVRDLWPESLVAVGASGTRSPLVAGLEKLARALYRSANYIVTVTSAQKEAIVSAGVSGETITVIPNGIDDEFVALAKGVQAPTEEFVVTYIGTLGMAHHLETLLEAAQTMRNDPGVRFQIVGEGARREALEAKARELQLMNVHFAGERPREEVPRWIAGSHACAVLLRKNDVFLTVVPSKMIEIMAVGCPIVLGVGGEAKALLERAGAGIAVEPENAEQLVTALRRLRLDDPMRQTLGRRGQQFVDAEFRRPALARKYLTVLSKLQQAKQAVPAEMIPETETASEAQ